MNINTGDISPLANLTQAERASGDWVPLPPLNADGHATAAKHLMAELLSGRAPSRPEQKGRFDANGKPIFTP